MQAHHRIGLELLKMIFVGVNIFSVLFFGCQQRNKSLAKRELLMLESDLNNFKNFINVSKT